MSSPSQEIGVGGSDYRVSSALIEFLQHCVDHEVVIAPVVSESISNLRAVTFEKVDIDEVDAENLHLLESALRVVVAYLADDGFAKGRRSQRKQA